MDSPLTLIASNGFSGNKLTSFTVPNNVTTIEDNAFYICREMTSFDWGNSQVTYVGNKAFGYTSFESFKFADTVTVVGASVFENSTTLKTVELSLGMTTLFPYATVFLALAFITMLFVRHGDSKPTK